LDLSGFNYNSGEDWSTQTKIYIMKITTTGVNGTGEFILRSFPLIENNDDYLTASGQSLYSESLPVYINTSGNICFHGSNISTLCNCSDITALWAESRRKDPDVYDDFISLVLDDANTLELYDYYYPFQPTKEKTIILTNNTQQCTWITDYIYVLEDGLELAKITKSTEARVSITSTITTEDKVLVAHPDQDYVYLIGETEQQVIDVLDDSVTTTTHDFSGYTDLMPLFDKDGNLWFSGDKYAKANMSSLYSHSVDAFCNYNFLIDSNNEYYDLDGNTLNPDVLTATIDIATYSEVTGAIKRYPQTYLFPYNQTDITQMYNQDIWFDSTGTEYDGSTNAYQIPASGEVTIEDGIKVIVDDNDGYDQVVEGDYFYFVVSGKGIVVDDWTDADLKLSFAPWDYEEYTKSIVVVDTEYNIEEKPDPDFVDLNYHVISGTWDDGTEIVFTTSSPGIGEVQLKVDDWCYGVCPYRTMYAYNSNYGTGEVVFNVEDIGRTATITYNVGYTR
jgi:lipocalin